MQSNAYVPCYVHEHFARFVEWDPCQHDDVHSVQFMMIVKHWLIRILCLLSIDGMFGSQIAFTTTYWLRQSSILSQFISNQIVKNVPSICFFFLFESILTIIDDSCEFKSSHNRIFPHVSILVPIESPWKDNNKKTHRPFTIYTWHFCFPFCRVVSCRVAVELSRCHAFFLRVTWS